MTTINRAVRKTQKRVARNAAKQNRAQINAEHNLVYAHQQVQEQLEKAKFKIGMNERPAWTPPTAEVRPEGSSLKTLFAL